MADWRRPRRRGCSSSRALCAGRRSPLRAFRGDASDSASELYRYCGGDCQSGIGRPSRRAGIVVLGFAACCAHGSKTWWKSALSQWKPVLAARGRELSRTADPIEIFAPIPEPDLTAAVQPGVDLSGLAPGGAMRKADTDGRTRDSCGTRGSRRRRAAALKVCPCLWAHEHMILPGRATLERSEQTPRPQPR